MNDTITAVATAPGRGGVGVIRISGPKALIIGEAITRKPLTPRHAHYLPFFDADRQTIDHGIALYFKAPHSFTGEDIVELQGHGGPVILDMLLEQITQQGARLARPGEFSERAFLNDKLDLAQAEAIADLIDASSREAAKQAVNSLQGEFSNAVNSLVEELIALRLYVEAAIDFPEEEIDFLTDGHVTTQLEAVMKTLNTVLYKAEQGVILREGMKVVIAGRPNAGKSSLLNRLAERDIAIVTDIAGTTRDLLREHIHIDGMPLHITDTAGLRDSDDIVEQMGISRAWDEIEQADRIVLVIDATDQAQLSAESHWPEFFTNTDYQAKLTVIFNKCDQLIERPNPQIPGVWLSAKTGDGIDELKSQLKAAMGFQGTTEGGFSARRRHIDALKQAQQYLENGAFQLYNHAAGELLAEDLRAAQDHLSEITGRFTPDDLLGRIFSSFCIGK
ncbi:MAG TPA: tRNA uridine-5-carboxymethylaminomethyl(34) synthesis GTPase MnmE [Marinagarivorans sp.]